MKFITVWLTLLVLVVAGNVATADGIVCEGRDGAGKGKHIVLLSGDEEYRSEEAMIQLGRILAVRHGFKCTILFAINPQTGEIDPLTRNNIPGMEALDHADMCVLSLRFRELPDMQMKHFADFVNSGKPIMGLRTATHAFAYSKDSKSPYAKYDWKNKDWPGGFGRQVLGETWVSHHGRHGSEATRGVIEPSAKNHPILRGVTDVFGPTDVYTVNPPADCTILMRGQVLMGMNPNDPPVVGKQKPADKYEKNNPMQPLVWLRDYKGETGKTSKVITTTMGAAVDLSNEGLRRLLVNACYWALGLEDKIPAKSNVDVVGDYKPTYFGFGKFTKGLKPADLELK
ncbi:MAG: ThuA domain-containing protein [Kiritimatiellae bacterium]|nr:ThuA domain-containing protein [Kiritimatiellia bacterium]MDD5521012.1 ThuA domain-containing protein [Kiritimatiellia bacterium]